MIKSNYYLFEMYTSSLGETAIYKHFATKRTDFKDYIMNNLISLYGKRLFYVIKAQCREEAREIAETKSKMIYQLIEYILVKNNKTIKIYSNKSKRENRVIEI